jgi:hypothetical protein
MPTTESNQRIWGAVYVRVPRTGPTRSEPKFPTRSLKSFCSRYGRGSKCGSIRNSVRKMSSYPCKAAFGRGQVLKDDAFSSDTLSGTWVATWNSGKISENVLRTGDQTQDSETMHKGEGRFMLSGGAPQTVSFPRQTMLCARRAYRNDKGSTFTALGREVIIALVVGSIYYGTLDTADACSLACAAAVAAA